ncbi:hypothetical protein RA11412_1739 [Rothia aeria]|uniref:Uncharacterized protein n=1 Tax=Rothia aeria TaxID=172042 RepID=A0A2Z5R000_9MICC|nr:hypothetical protein RA11412_1739 [Rothia aeria]
MPLPQVSGVSMRDICSLSRATGPRLFLISTVHSASQYSSSE